jgi:pyridoxamine 5'-phosphate oxidase
MKIADLRQEYMRAGLSEAQADPDPIRQFERWFDEALRAGLPLPNSMTLATVTSAGAPSARIVLLKGVERGQFLFYTNYLSRKGRELEHRAAACLVFLWS